MQKKMISRGLEGTTLTVRAQCKGAKDREVTDKQLVDLVKTLSEAERAIGVLSRRGVDFEAFVNGRGTGPGDMFMPIDEVVKQNG